jgi:hypothetical protein
MFAEDLSEFLDTTDGFAVDAQWSLTNGTVQLIFDRPYENVLNVSSGQPQAVVRDAQMPGVAIGQTINIAGNVFKIAELQPDGTGLTTLLLNKV